VARILVALGLLTTLVGVLVCWPLGRLLMTHEHGHARVLAIYRDQLGSGALRLRTVFEVETSPGQWVLGDAQTDQFFRPIGDPALDGAESDEVEARLLPDAQNRQMLPLVFWKANDPAATAFIIDVSRTHWWRRYVGGLAACAVGLITARLAWAFARRSA
jgi:hypothetical protein